MWNTTISYINVGDLQVRIASGLDAPALKAHSEGEVQFEHLAPDALHGVIVIGTRGELDTLCLQTRTYPAQHPEGGVVLPGIRRSALGLGPVHLVDIRTSQTSRTLLRIYDMNLDLKEGLVLVHFKDKDGNELASQAVSLANSPLNPLFDIPQYPLYSQIAVGNDLPSRLSIDIEPLTPFLRLWAFTTTTDNQTQSVVAVLPVR